MTTTIDVTSNMSHVLRSITDLKRDLKKEMRKRVGAAMRVLLNDVRHYIAIDPMSSGGLLRATTLEKELGDEMLEYAITVDGEKAPYAAMVEFGSGSRTERPFAGGNKPPAAWPDSGSAVPKDYPFESPDIEHNVDDPTSTQNSEFWWFQQLIEDWMKTKPVTPLSGNIYISSVYIASEIIQKGNYAHPYLRPAYFDNELKLKRAAKNAVRNATR
jgi:hypothetical protein